LAGISRVALSRVTSGTLVERGARVVVSEQVGQPFTDPDSAAAARGPSATRGKETLDLVRHAQKGPATGDPILRSVPSGSIGPGARCSLPGSSST